MDKKKSQIPVFLGIASVWFGAHVGPGVASGKQTAVYYSAFGKWGLITPIIAMTLMGLCIYYSIEYARLTGVRNFKELTDKLFYPYHKIFSTFFEITFIATVLMVVGGCFATGAVILQQYLGLPIAIGTGILALITILLSIYGSDLVRASSTVMTVFILIALALIVILGLTSSQADFRGHWNTTSFSDFSPWNAIMLAVVYTGFQSAGNIANAVSVAEGLESKKESKKAALIGTILNTLLLMSIAFLLFAYPDSIGQTMPNYYILDKLGIPILMLAYVILVLLAVISTTVSFSFSVLARYGDFLPIKPGRNRDLAMTLILVVLTVAVSSVGLDAIVGKGYKYLGYACIPIVVIPTILVGRVKTKRLED